LIRVRPILPTLGSGLNKTGPSSIASTYQESFQMELTHPVANSTNTATNTIHGEALTTAFNWRNPMFPVPRPRSKPSGSDRVPGSVRSSRPRWTPEKHARILAQIKATRTDLDPSFPRPEPVAEGAGQASVQSMVKGAVHQVGQTTKSYVDSLTAYAIEQFYSLALPGSASGGGPGDLAIQKQEFSKTLLASGLSDTQAADLMAAWTAAGIPLVRETLPARYVEKMAFEAHDQQFSGLSGAAMLTYHDGASKMALKCYAPLSEDRLSYVNQMTGIDALVPKFEVRSLLASFIAHNVFCWDIVPPVSLAFFGGRVCTMAPFIEGASLHKALMNNLPLSNAFLHSLRDGAIHVDEWKDHVGDQFKEDYLRLTLFAMLIGDHDRHLNQFITQGKRPNLIKGIDWDLAFGSKFKTDENPMLLAEHLPAAFWPTSIPKAIAEEFGRVSKDQLVMAAEKFGLSSDEVGALSSRFEAITRKLATVKKI
jgi:hypothetical protein